MPWPVTRPVVGVWPRAVELRFLEEILINAFKWIFGLDQALSVGGAMIRTC